MERSEGQEVELFQIAKGCLKHYRNATTPTGQTDVERENSARAFWAGIAALQPFSRQAEDWLVDELASSDLVNRNAALRILLEIKSNSNVLQNLARDLSALRAFSFTQSNQVRLWQEFSPSEAFFEEALLRDAFEIYPIFHALSKSEPTFVRPVANRILRSDPSHGLIHHILRWIYCENDADLMTSLSSTLQAALRTSDDESLLQSTVEALFYQSLMSGDSPDVRLVEFSEHEDQATAVTACGALAQLGVFETVYPAEKLLHSSDLNIQKSAINLAYLLKSPLLLKSLIELSQRGLWFDPEPTVFYSAAHVIRDIAGGDIFFNTNIQAAQKIEQLAHKLDDFDPHSRYSFGEKFTMVHLRQMLISPHHFVSEPANWTLVSMLGEDAHYDPDCDLIYNIHALDKWDALIKENQPQFEPGKWYFKKKLTHDPQS